MDAPAQCDLDLISFGLAIVLTRHIWSETSCTHYFSSDELFGEVN